jgi:hypothetical protein
MTNSTSPPSFACSVIPSHITSLLRLQCHSKAHCFHSSSAVSLRIEFLSFFVWNIYRYYMQHVKLLLYFLFIYLFFYFAVALRPNAGHGLLILEVSRSHTTTHHSR